ncbi:cobyric acid synthase [Corynebacterium mendelii]|uniref:Cobyric acid synthase n=1 Tax=Corynebacterium mendelii TaxID=2765362 RepID=A0A939DYL6_9CORY|nr:cobyric acid synthase [Corynebacterium mendelii]
MTAVLIAGTTSDAGKSVVVAGLCRAFARRGINVAPFKAQNMSNNSTVCPSGGEIGRAQALQALACGLEPSVDFNPVLLKPGSDRKSQLVVQGLSAGEVTATSYFGHRSHLRTLAADTLHTLEKRFDLVICEGAGSPAEINLRHSDVANMGLVEAHGPMPVYLVGDIDRGGVLAHLFGTHRILPETDRDMIAGFVINKFRGDETILAPGLAQLEQLTGVETVAVLPFIDGLWVDAEDSLQSVTGTTIGPRTPPVGTQRLTVAAIRLPRVSNATDVEALACEPGVSVTWVDSPDAVDDADLVVLPGSKATVSDLAWLETTGMAQALVRRTRANQPTLAICGGFQMMATTICDPVESKTDHPVPGLGVFDMRIVFDKQKTLIRHKNGAYEVHHGQVADSREQPWIGQEGAHRGHLFGTHRHGLMEDDCFRREFLRGVAAARGKTGFIAAGTTSFAAERLRQLDLIADTLESCWDLDRFLADVEAFTR